MKPKVVICGRPNVGKSTLFNQFTSDFKAIVHNRPGVTRDWVAGTLKHTDIELIDTAGLHEITDEQLTQAASNKSLEQMNNATLILLIVDGRAGLTYHDEYCANILRKQIKVPVVLVINKVEGKNKELFASEFYSLGFDTIFVISSSHRLGLQDLKNHIETVCTPEEEAKEEIIEAIKEEISEEVVVLNDDGNVVVNEIQEETETVRIAILGRPNVGKSTLTNKILGSDRMIVSQIPGTTVDAVSNLIEYKDKKIELIDTAGIRRKGKIEDYVETEGTKNARNIAERADIIIFVTDISVGIVHQDQLLANLIAGYGRATTVILNKSDLIEESEIKEERSKAKRELHFMDYAQVILTSIASTKFKPEKLLEDALKSLAGARTRVAPHKLSKILRAATMSNSPPRSHGKRPALRYAHQAGTNPPLIVIHGRHVDLIKDPYLRYLAGKFTENVDFGGAPIHIRLKESETKKAAVR